MTYVALLRANLVNYEAIDDHISNYYDRVKRKGEKRTIHEYLGMSEEDYNKWKINPDYLQEIRYGKDSKTASKED